MVHRTMKIRPSDRFLRKVASESGEAVLVIGTRKAESANRAISIRRFEREATRENFQKNVNLLNVVSYLPIKNWTNDDVWLYLLQELQEWGINNKDLLSMYQGATDGGECPLVVDTSTLHVEIVDLVAGFVPLFEKINQCLQWYKTTLKNLGWNLCYN